jgi:hypothetical protein
MTIDLADPIALLLAAASSMDRARIRAAAYGGLTLGMYGEPRETRDADLAVASANAEAARDALAALGVTAVVAFTGVVFGGNAVTRLTLVGGSAHNTVDLVQPRSARYATAVLDRALIGSLRGTEITVVTPEDFILMKILSTRARDLEDAQSVIDTLGPRLDQTLLRDEAQQLSGELADHDVLGRFAALRNV